MKAAPPGNGKAKIGRLAGLAILAGVVALAIFAVRANSATTSGGANPSPAPIPTAVISPRVVAATATPNLASAPEVISGFQPRGIAFIRNDNLWVTDASGAASHEVQVTKNGGLSYPSWSYSGQWLTVIGFGKRWLISTQGEMRLLDGVATTTAAWSPTEDSLAYVTTDGTYLYDVARAANRRLFDTRADGVAWSPDGTKLAVGTDDERVAAQSLPAPAVRVVSVDNLKVMQLAPGPVIGTETIVAGWTGDGQTVLAWVNPILSADIRAGGLFLYSIPLSGGATAKLGGSPLYPDYVATQPKTSIVAFVDGGGRQAWTQNSLVFAKTPGGGVDHPAVVPGALASPAWSPDGSRFAYVAGPALQDVSGGDVAKAALMQRRIWVQPASGGTPTKLTDDPAYRDEHPQWGSNQCILFARVNANDEPTLWLSNGSGAPRMTARMSFTDPNTTWFGYYGHIAWDAIYDWWPAHDYQVGGGNTACQ